MQPIQEVYSQLVSPQQITITTHQKPDGDAMGSSLGLLHFLVAQGHQVRVISPTNWADFLEWMPGIDQVFNFEQQKEKALQWLDQSDWLFCLDFNVFHRTKHLAPYLAKAKAKKVLVDHHEQPDTPNFDYGISLTSKSSTCEMIYDFIQASPKPELLNPNMAACLYTGVMTDTGSFRFASTGASVHRMVATLKETGFNHTDVHNQIYDNFLESRLRFIGFVLTSRMEVFYEYNTALMYISQKDLQDYHIKTGDTE
ncbi:MAG: bifunctional oligoribonuclease/PAP phosphatase NrnA, partial [Sphingobacteriia bacterium]